MRLFLPTYRYLKELSNCHILTKLKLNYTTIQIQNVINNKKMFENLFENVQKLSERLKKENVKFSEIYSIGGVSLAQYGWYIGANIPLLKALDAMTYAKLGKQSEIDKIFLYYYSKNLERLASEIADQYPTRKQIINEAIKCHKLKMFYASTSLFLAQADGICNGELFKTKHSKAAIKKFIKESSKSDKISAILSPILEESAIDIYHPDKTKFNSDLNRHGVMHGYDTNYGTEINSLKAFSLICYIKDFIDRYNKNK